MKFYAAIASPSELEAVEILPPVRILLSYHYFKKYVPFVQDCVRKRYEIIIDSGAFSANTQGAAIDIDEYCQFIMETGATTYAALDVIGNAEATMRNTEYMQREYFLKPFPTFHMGSNIKHLERMLDFPYIALGGMVFGQGVERNCDVAWNLLLKRAKGIRVHGFGLTNIDLMARYPWYSVDSSSYKSCRRFGRQNIIWNGLEFKTIPEDEYRAHLDNIGYRMDTLTNAEKYKVYDFHSVQSYKAYAAHLAELNKIKNFSYLTAQQNLFDDV